MKKALTIGLKIALFNFIIVAIYGTVMRYKIAFSLPFVEQKHLQEAHSHFAFYGWVTTALYFLILRNVKNHFPEITLKKYIAIIVLNLIGSYGMLASFTLHGYYWLSIAFSTVSLISSFLYLFVLAYDLKGKNTSSGKWYLGGLFFALLSSFGVFYLAYSLASKNITQDGYLACTYYYLHFQYNGFFIFACIGLLLEKLTQIGAKLNEKLNLRIFILMFIGCVLGYGLSVLWMKLPLWIFGIIVIGSISQTLASGYLLQWVRKNWTLIKEKWTPFQRFILFYVGFAFTVKILLQLGSNIPALNQFAFGFRNIVIAYLHLVLLMCVATYLLFEVYTDKVFSYNKTLIVGVKLFLLGTFLNELVLGVNGILSIKYIMLPNTQYYLLVISALIAVALMLILGNLKIKKDDI
ncbi:hypothetical protein [Elizabethkingia sp. JS20170427COW]|uniref:hypothetical protein n=1 Tax=Elizabethkingia sp. JS20170427COW TaxID=2583851 RepID=UPI00162705E6|nr:hypothetical protein [Elizabethkingia sp. JS20170427COW]